MDLRGVSEPCGERVLTDRDAVRDIVRNLVINALEATEAGGVDIAYRLHNSDLEILVEGDRQLFNQYGVVLVSPQRHPHVKAADGEAFIKWLTSPAGQAAIAAYRIDGAQAFFPNARKAGS